jgi:hypothetical protein
MGDISDALIRALLERLPRPECSETIATYASGPFDEDDFDELLGAIGLKPDMFTRISEIVVIGRNGWTAEKLNRIVVQRRGMDLRVYSQEMFLDFITSGIDPLSAQPNVVKQTYGIGHPALEFLSQDWPNWPTTHVDESAGGTFGVDSPEQGVLSRLGYRVGGHGEAVGVRRAILRRVFERSLSANLGVPAYLAQWGEPLSAARLSKMAETIAAFCRNARRRNESELRQAITEWEEDLKWLRATYHSGVSSFQWPSTRID